MKVTVCDGCGSRIELYAIYSRIVSVTNDPTEFEHSRCDLCPRCEAAAREAVRVRAVEESRS